MKYFYVYLLALVICSCSPFSNEKKLVQKRASFNDAWKFQLGDISNGKETDFDDTDWRQLNLPHDWSLEGEFSPEHPATVGGGALPGGIGWYRKSFKLSPEDSNKCIYIEFDGVYQNSEVWINGNYLGNRPNGYISFQYELTPHLKFGDSSNLLAVKVSNWPQPNSRWYSGSGIYRNVWLTKYNSIHVKPNTTFITTPEIDVQSASVVVASVVENEGDNAGEAEVQIEIRDTQNNLVVQSEQNIPLKVSSEASFEERLTIQNPGLWSLEQPNLYKAVIKVFSDAKLVDISETQFGVRYFAFDPNEGFSLNGRQTKIKGVCNHHDLGCLGAAINKRALQRQLEIMRGMGVNAIRTAHNPPAPELLDLCDEMGFIVMDEMFDVWKKGKSEYDYHLHWDEWHEEDLGDFIKRDRNHPSVIIWSIGNEILEQWDSTGIPLTKELVSIVRSLDTTRAITTGNNPPGDFNNITKAGAFDLVGYNYHHDQFENFPENFPGKCFIATETSSALATRGHYDMPSDTIKRWPIRWDLEFTEGNSDNTVSAYDHVSTPWGSSHEETWKIIKKHNFLSGMFIWTGFDYLGEPTPYGWPSRSSYFGVVDLAGFPKDSYYMYKSEWTEEPVLHVFPHWNWEPGQEIDIWAYTNEDSVELFVNGQSMGIKSKAGDELHIWWRLTYEPGEVVAQGYKNGEKHLAQTLKTANEPSAIKLETDRKAIAADGSDLSFITVRVVDKHGTLHPNADNLVEFEISGPGRIIGVDNGNPVSHASFQANSRKAFHGLCLVVIQSTHEKGQISLSARSGGLDSDSIKIIAE